MKYKECEWCAEHVGPLNFWGNFVLLLVKATCGIMGHSRALLADAIHSFSDVVTGGFVWISLKITKKSSDERYPYGYGHIEFIAAAIVGIFLIFAAISIWYTSIVALIKGILPKPEIITILACLISIGGNELLSRYSLCIGKEAGSPVMIATARENRADSMSSTAALVGIIGARLGFRFLDPVAAIVVGSLIFYLAIKMIYDSVNGLMDSSLEKKQMEKIRNLASSIKGTKAISSLKARKSGQKIWIDLEILIDPQITVNQTKVITEKIKESILRNLDRVGNIVVRFRPAT